MGLNFHEQGSFAEAIKSYEAEISKGHVNSDLFYNLGHAYYRDGQKGQAMAALLAAKRFAPRDPDVNANLKFVHKTIDDNLSYSKDQGLLTVVGFWLERVTVKESAWMLAITACVSGLFLLLTQLMEKFRRLQGAAFLSLLLPALMAVNLYLSFRHDQPWGAVVTSKSPVRSGPSGKNKVVFELREGAPFSVTGSVSGWMRIELSDGKKGWISKSDGRAFAL
jgi:tetratricopeptide (TPR) repeat protein